MISMGFSALSRHPSLRRTPMSGNGEDFRDPAWAHPRALAPARPRASSTRCCAPRRRRATPPRRLVAGKPTGLGRSTFGRGRIAFSRNRLFSTSRRVVVKARIARHQGRAFRSAPMSAHVAYLKREGVTRDGEKARMFDAETRPRR